jgi:hypothetical protein
MPKKSKFPNAQIRIFAEVKAKIKAEAKRVNLYEYELIELMFEAYSGLKKKWSAK